MTPAQRRAAAAQELVRAADQLREVARAGKATQSHRDRLTTAEKAWDAMRPTEHQDAAA